MAVRRVGWRWVAGEGVAVGGSENVVGVRAGILEKVPLDHDPKAGLRVKGL